MAELIVPPALRERHRQGLARYLETGEATDPRQADRDHRACAPTAREFPVELTITRIAVAGPPLFTGHLRDITERKEMIEELRASRARLVARPTTAGAARARPPRRRPAAAGLDGP